MMRLTLDERIKERVSVNRKKKVYLCGRGAVVVCEEPQKTGKDSDCFYYYSIIIDDAMPISITTVACNDHHLVQLLH